MSFTFSVYTDHLPGCSQIHLYTFSVLLCNTGSGTLKTTIPRVLCNWYLARFTQWEEMLKDWRAGRKEQPGYFSPLLCFTWHLLSGCISCVFPVSTGYLFPLCSSFPLGNPCFSPRSYWILQNSCFQLTVPATESPCPVPPPRLQLPPGVPDSWTLPTASPLLVAPVLAVVEPSCTC